MLILICICIGVWLNIGFLSAYIYNVKVEDYPKDILDWKFGDVWILFIFTLLGVLGALVVCLGHIIENVKPKTLRELFKMKKKD